MTAAINRFISAVLIPILLSAWSPVPALMHARWQPKELVGISQSEVMEEDVFITAHRGVNGIAPDNTIPAYEKAVACGYYSAECDIRLTKDNQWVLYHDPFLISKFWRLGTVEHTDFETLRTYRYAAGTNYWKYPDMQIPTLDEFLDVFIGSSTRPQIEIKSSNYDMLHTVVDAVRAKGLEKQAIIISFDLKQLQTIRDYDEEIELWYLVYRIKPKNIDEAKALGNCWISADRNLNSENTIAPVLEQGVGLSLWTVDSVKDAEKLYRMGVRYIETDRLCP